MKARTLLKVGGAELQASILDSLVAALALVAEERELIVVHGGGADIAALQKRLGLEPRFVDGLRVTDEECLRVAEMALSGTVNKRLVGRLVMCGVRAIGVSGVDAGLLRARKLVHPKGDLGRVGEITQVSTHLLTDLLSLGLTPVVSPISLGHEGETYNVNADHAAMAIAGALRVEEMVFLTDVPGVLHQGRILERLSTQKIDQLIDAGHITGGMIPKVRSALEVIRQGAGSARITNLDGLAAGTGTWVIH